ncbi:hypothetical protein BJF93_00960 [Xaviernesmea oryzae]|uniref:Uncharacterized protein n=1 Tax=Xaviernesmea oryzae TaxID=464029 RepID=A0A1Q9B3T1_9HYPH|nr:hypothetical protein [Xaviernesmea oryzae]OLP62706.1 hypothetical protein BJF93_00960 [Xaviernesmea oryzae]SEM26991.1 hypothetical protein SAMN04487976_1264 [Xaviernesmea oryzae]
MTELPPFPSARRNPTDLDALIDASIGRPTVGASSATVPDARDTAGPDENKPLRSTDRTPTERFRVMIDPAVIIATKHSALQHKIAPSEVVERALRQYLGLDRT